MSENSKRTVLLEKAVELIGDFYDGLNDHPVSPSISLDEIRKRVSAFTFDGGTDTNGVLTEVASLLGNGNLLCAHPRYFGLFNTTPLPASVAADLLVSGFNPQMGVHHHAPASVEMEEHVLRFVGERFGLPEDQVAGCFTNGGSEANHTGALLALTNAFPEFREHGTRGLSGSPVFYVSQEAHHSFVKIAHACGLGRNAVHFVPVLDDLRMDLDALERQIGADRAAGMKPFMIVATAGHTSSGVFDQLEECADICEKNKLHLHVDAAWGGAAAFSDELRQYLQGIERADSIAFDAHKWSLPIATGIFLCTDRAGLRKTFSVDAQYVPPGAEDLTHYYIEGIQWSRRSIGMRLFLTLATIGIKGYAATIEHQTKMGNLLKQRLSDEGWKLHNDTPLPLACFSHPELDGAQNDPTEEIAKRYQDVAQRIVKKGKCWISVTSLRGRPVLRACITSYLVTPEDVGMLLDELCMSLEESVKGS